VGATDYDENLSIFYSFVIIYAVGRTPWAKDQPAARPLPTQDNTNAESTQTSMPRLELELTTPMFKQAKKLHSSDRAATVVGSDFATPKI
jgi:hypothetical protein